MLSNSLLFQCSDHKESEAIPVTGRGGLYGFEILRITHFIDNQHTKVKLSALHASLALPTERFSSTHFC
jgi:hypothetical protein